jgi:outer membrane protein assembly factor BamD (BamD/ComL family)
MLDEAERLAVAAEDALARGDRAEAIAWLEKIVRKHSRSRQARAAMLDVARLRSAAGDRDGAACAYQRFLERYPNDEMRPDVNRRLGALDISDVECRGIDPAE